MNKIIYKLMRFGCALMCTTTFLSCTDILDQLPKDSLTGQTVWTDPQGAVQFVNAIYGQMPSGFDRNYQGWAKGLYLLDGASDDGDVGMLGLTQMSYKRVIFCLLMYLGVKHGAITIV